MSTLEEKQRAAKEHLDKVSVNPASTTAAPAAERKRIPMTLPQQRLAVPEIPGYHLHWMKGTPERLRQAENAGYEYVDQSEVDLNDPSIGGTGLKGHSDMGTRVTRLANPVGGGEDDGHGQPLTLVLMKQKEEWYLEDQKLLQARNDSVVDALTAGIRSGTVGADQAGGDTSMNYVDQKRTRLAEERRSKIPDFFRRKS